MCNDVMMRMTQEIHRNRMREGGGSKGGRGAGAGYETGNNGGRNQEGDDGGRSQGEEERQKKPARGPRP